MSPEGVLRVSQRQEPVLGHDDERRSIVICTPYLPSDETAGERLLTRHIAALRSRFDVGFVALRTDEDRLLAEAVHDGPCVLVDRGDWAGLKRARLLHGLCFSTVAHRWPSSAPDVARLLGGADIVELHWSDALALEPVVRRLAPRAAVVAYYYEILNDPYRSWSRGRWSRQRLFHDIVAARQRSAERSLVKRFDRSIVLSQKDAALLRALGVSHPINVVSPPIEVEGPVPPVHGGTTVLFSGVMGRRENHESATWFIDSVWPRVSAACPEARLVIAGAAPPDSLRARASATVNITGRVPDLNPFFRESRVYAAPILWGAGVKLKVLEAMAHGVPVVATPAAADGIVDVVGPDSFAGITGDPNRFAESVIRCLTDDSSCAAPALIALGRVEQHYRFHDDMAKVIEAYVSWHQQPHE